MNGKKLKNLITHGRVIPHAGLLYGMPPEVKEQLGANSVPNGYTFFLFPNPHSRENKATAEFDLWLSQADVPMVGHRRNLRGKTWQELESLGEDEVSGLRLEGYASSEKHQLMTVSDLYNRLGDNTGIKVILDLKGSSPQLVLRLVQKCLETFCEGVKNGLDYTVSRRISFQSNCIAALEYVRDYPLNTHHFYPFASVDLLSTSTEGYAQESPITIELYHRAKQQGGGLGWSFASVNLALSMNLTVVSLYWKNIIDYPAIVSHAHNYGLKLHAWGLTKNFDTLETLLGMGVDAVIFEAV